MPATFYLGIDVDPGLYPFTRVPLGGPFFINSAKPKSFQAASLVFCVAL